MATIAVYTNFGGRTLKENRGGTKRGYVPDPLGSTKALVDSSGAVTDTWEYWPYGEVESHTGPSATPFTFVGTLGYFKDAVSKLTYVRARFYQAFTGQWMTKDPIWPSEQAYRYAASIPILLVDPTGLIVWWVYALILILGAACAWCAINIWRSIGDIPMGEHPQDKVKHCIFFCMVRMKCGGACAGLGIPITELFDLFRKYILRQKADPTWEDVAANATGASCGGLSMFTTCIPWWFWSPRSWCEGCCDYFNYGQIEGDITPMPTV